MSSTSTCSTDDTLIISDSEDLDFKTHATMEEDLQELDQDAHQSPVLIEESRSAVNDCAKELVQGTPQTEEEQNFC